MCLYKIKIIEAKTYTIAIVADSINEAMSIARKAILSDEYAILTKDIKLVDIESDKID